MGNTKKTYISTGHQKIIQKMALRVGSSMLLRSMRPSRASLISKRAMSEMAFTFAAPNGVHYKDASVKQVDVPSFSGSFGILPDHVPALAALDEATAAANAAGDDAAKAEAQIAVEVADALV